MKNTITLFLLALCIGSSAGAQNADRKIVYPEHYWGDADLYLDKQHEALLSHVNVVLKKHPPTLPAHPGRKSALHMIDAVLHDVKAPERNSVQTFFHGRMKLALAELAETEVDTGAVIWKLYDHGFIVRTKSVTIAFDLIRGHSAKADGFAVSDELMEKIVVECDVLFISHHHGDHADETVVGMFLAQGKPVAAPSNILADKPIHAKITHLERTPHVKQKIPLKNSGLSLDVVTYPGHQGDLENNVSLVFTPEGMSFCHTGDQANDGDFAWIDEVRKHHKVDILMPNCWTTDMVRLAEGFNPAVVITGHENELGHTIDHREPFWLTYRRFPTDKYPLMLMAWGESFRYEP